MHRWLWLTSGVATFVATLDEYRRILGVGPTNRLSLSQYCRDCIRSLPTSCPPLKQSCRGLDPISSALEEVRAAEIQLCCMRAHPTLGVSPVTSPRGWPKLGSLTVAIDARYISGKRTKSNRRALASRTRSSSTVFASRYRSELSPPAGWALLPYRQSLQIQDRFDR